MPLKDAVAYAILTTVGIFLGGGLLFIFVMMAIKATVAFLIMAAAIGALVALTWSIIHLESRK